MPIKLVPVFVEAYTLMGKIVFSIFHAKMFITKKMVSLFLKEPQITTSQIHTNVWPITQVTFSHCDFLSLLTSCFMEIVSFFFFAIIWAFSNWFGNGIGAF